MIITLLQLRTAVRQRCNMENSAFITDAELNTIINGEAAELHDLVVSRFEDQFTVCGTNITTVTSSAPTYVTSGMYKLRAVERLYGTEWRDVPRFDFEDRNRTTGAVKYRLVGSTLYFTPTADATATYRIWYVPSYVDLAADGSTLDYPQNWHEYVIAGAAAQCLAKEESDPGPHLQRKADLRGRILAMAMNVDAARPEKMLRIRNRRRDGDDECEFGDPDFWWGR